MATLLRQQHELADVAVQRSLLNAGLSDLPTFEQKLRGAGVEQLQPAALEVLQVNVGKKCNQTCRHCHVDAGPDRTEVMDRQTMEQCLQFIERSAVRTVDITGGAPELHPHFRWFVAECRKRHCHVMDRCNLTIIVSHPRFHDLPQFFAQHQVEVICSLPYFTAQRTDQQRGEGVFADSLRALRMLNDVGYGVPDSGLVLNLVYNPVGAFLSGPQHVLEEQFRKVLQAEYNITFNRLFTITNMPISRFLEFLVRTGQLKEYMEKLLAAFNPATVPNLMCRNTLSVSWDGFLYDCDFNQMLDMKVTDSYGQPAHISTVDIEWLALRPIQVGRHCFGCTAGSGSSCGGALLTN